MPLFAQLSETVTIQEISGQRLFNIENNSALRSDRGWKSYDQEFLHIVIDRFDPPAPALASSYPDSRQKFDQKVSSLTIPIQVVSHHQRLTLSSNSTPPYIARTKTPCVHQSTFRAPKHLVCTKAPCTHQSTSIDIHSSSSDRAPDSSEDLESFTLICHMTFAYSSTSGICLPNIYDIFLRQKKSEAVNDVQMKSPPRVTTNVMHNDKTPAGITSTMPQFAQETVDDVLVSSITNNFSPLHQTLLQLIESPGANLSPKTYNFLQQLFTFMTIQLQNQTLSGPVSGVW